MVTISHDDVPGILEVVEEMPGKVVMMWEFYLDRSENSHLSRGEYFETPPFWFEDPSGDRHEWYLSFCDKSSAKCCVEHDCISIKYRGYAKPGNSRFVIKFRVCTANAKFSEQCFYNDTSSKITPQLFAEESTYEIIVSNLVKDYNLGLKIWCSIIACPAVDEQNGSPYEHQISLLKDQELLFESGAFSDVTFIVGEHSLQLHKSILSNRSPVFAAMFYSDCKESILNEVKIDDQTYEVMKEFFRYVYAARVNDIENHALELLKTSDKYAVVKLKSMCEQSIVEALKNENVVEYLNFADRYSAKSLETECLKLLVSNAKEIVELPTFSLNNIPINHTDYIFKAVARRT